MSMRYRRSIKLAPGIKLNVTKTGIGATVGTKGAHYSVHSSGRRTSTVGLPGTGLYYQQSRKATSSRRASAPAGGPTPSQALKQHERHVKKVELAEERRGKPLEKLREFYAAGKVPEKRFVELEKRDADITLDLMIFGHASGLRLAERYMFGLINQDEFEHIKDEIIGPSESEKNSIVGGFKDAIKAVNEFAEKCRSQKTRKACNYCLKKRGLFTLMYPTLDFQLCSSCRKQFAALRNYPGVRGEYYTAASTVLSPDEKNNLNLNINPQYVLAYR